MGVIVRATIADANVLPGVPESHIEKNISSLSLHNCNLTP
jgi:hypothetical protein